MKEKEIEWDSDRLTNKAEDVIEAIGKDVKSFLEKNVRNPQGEEVSDVQGDTSKFLFCYNFDTDEFEWGCHIDYEDAMQMRRSRRGVGEKEYISTKFINKFIAVIEDILPIMEVNFDGDIEAASVYRKEFKKLVQNIRLSMDISDVEEMIENNELDKMLTLLGTDPSYQDHIWDIVKKWENGNIVDREPEILTRSDKRITLRVEKEYEGKKSTAGYVIGLDDTIDRFFIHKLQNSNKLNDAPATQWCDKDIKEMMGFDKDINRDTITQDLKNIGIRIRLQGDLRVVSEDYREILQLGIQQRIINEHALEYINSFREKIEDNLRDIRLSRGVREKTPESRRIHLTNPKTERIKEIQDIFNIEEEKVRMYQERDELERLHPSRREDYVSKIIEERVVSENMDEYENVKEEIKNEVGFGLSVIGNHMILIKGVYTELSESITQGIRFVVPEETTAVIMHDEHTPQKFKIPQGAYTFDFLKRDRVQEIMN